MRHAPISPCSSHRGSWRVLAVVRAPKTMWMALISALVVGALGGCSLIFMPPEEAVMLCLDPMASKDSDITELIPDGELRGQVKSVSTTFRGPLYNRENDFWRVDEIEEDELEERTYVYVLVDVPRKRQWIEVELVFEMERSGRSWIIHDVAGIGALNKELELAKHQK